MTRSIPAPTLSTRSRVPTYGLHKAQGHALVRLPGRAPEQAQLGRHGSPESVALYGAALAFLEAGGGVWTIDAEAAFDALRSNLTASMTALVAGTDPVAAAALVARSTRCSLTVHDLVERFREHCDATYPKSIGRGHSSSAEGYRQATAPLLELAPDELAADFGPLNLKEARQRHVDRGLARKTANRHADRIVFMFKWAVSEELIDALVWDSLRSVEGMTTAPETKPVTSVPIEQVEKVLPFLSPPVRAIIQLLRYSGARPGEIVRLRGVDIDTSGDVWFARLDDHKTSHHENAQPRVIPFGPKAQAILHEFMTPDRPLAAFLFDPRESVRWHAEQRAAKGKRRRASQAESPRTTRRQVRDCFTTQSLGTAVRRACKKAGVPSFGPNRLRSSSSAIRWYDHPASRRLAIVRMWACSSGTATTSPSPHE